jgi:hypothetical protein
LLCGDDVDRLDEPVAFSWIDELAGSIVLSRRLCDFRFFSEIRLAVESREYGRADQPGAGEGGENRAGEPAQRNAAAINGCMLAAIRFDRGVDSKIDQAERP